MNGTPKHVVSLASVIAGFPTAGVGSSGGLYGNGAAIVLERPAQRPGQPVRERRMVADISTRQLVRNSL
jgi:hypothetical protein